MWDLKACRCCLETKGKLEKIGEAYIRFYTAVTGLEILERDGYPTYMCLECSSQMKRALAFRRKCRRAYYVLKEIMMVRKQVCYNDIAMVDRRRTNLSSSLNLWKPQSTGFYTIATPDAYEVDDFKSDHMELQTGEEKSEYSFDISYDANKSYHLEIKHSSKAADNTNAKVNSELAEYTKNTNNIANGNTEMTEYTPTSNDTATCIVIDIKPGNYKEIEREEEERRLEEIKQSEEVDNQNDYVEDDNDGIDLDDVFKDLKEESEEESAEETFEEVELPPIKPVVKKKTNKTTGEPKFQIEELHKVCKALDNAKIRSLSEEERMESFKQRMLCEPFKSAMYKCAVCLTVFDGMPELLVHVKIHNLNSGTFVCHICKYMFKSAELLEVHVAHNHGYEFTCKKCNSTWYTLESLVACFSKHKFRKIPKEDDMPKSSPVPMIQRWFNLSTLRPDQMSKTLDRHSGYLNGYTCDKCNIGFIDSSELNKHMYSHIMPNPVGQFDNQCDMCKCWFRNRQNITKHIQSWHMYSYECKICYATLMNKVQAVHHKNGHMSQGVRPGVQKPAIVRSYECEFCGKIFKSTQALLLHHNGVHYDAMRTVHCQLCGYPCTRHFHLYKHQLKEHNHIYIMDPSSPELKFTCKACGNKFVDEKAYHTHLVKLAHEKDRRIELSCRVCRKMFDTSEELEKHDVKCVSSSCFPAKCCYCDTVSETPKDHRKHFDTKHPELEYRNIRHASLCELCGKMVVKMQKHLKEHAENQIFDANLNCQFCQAKIQSPRAYVSHMLFNHTPKPYLCKECPAQFKYRCECRDHILKVHAPEMMFSCKPCGRRFSHIDFLQEHSLKAHNVDVKKKFTASRRMKGKIFVYPHMKINGALIDAVVLENVTVEMCDYLNENNKVVPYTDCFVFDPTTEPIIHNMNNIPPKPPKVKKKETVKRNDGNKVTVKVKKEVKKEKSADGVIAKSKMLLGKRKIILKDDPEDVITKMPKKFEADENHDSQNFGVTDYSYGEDNQMYVEESKIEEEIVKEMGEMYDCSQDVEEVQYVDQKYEVIEEDGEQFVMIDGEVYKLEVAD